MNKKLLTILISSILTLILLSFFVVVGWNDFVFKFIQEPKVTLSSAFIAPHMEVGGTPNTLDYQKRIWPTLIELVELADKYNIKLTLEFNPQWAEYILQDHSRLTQLRSWEQDGHEIALHHHGPSHGDWNGYTNNKESIQKGEENQYIGPVTDMMDLMKQLPISGNILTGGITNENIDWPKGIIYDTDGGELKDDLLSKPRHIVWNDFSVTQLRYRQYATVSRKAATLDEIESAYYSADKDEVMGIVFHAADYNKRFSDIEKLFISLSEHNINIKTVKDILSSVISQCGDGICDEIEKGQCSKDCHVVRYLCPADLYRNLKPYQSEQPLEQFCEKEPQTGIVFMPGDRGYGVLSGLVVDDKGNPIPNVQIYICEKSPVYPVVQTNAQGRFSTRVPAASSRYVVKAKKDGYISNAIGNFEIWDKEETKVTITLLPDNIPDADIYSEELFVARIAVTQVDASNDEIIQPDLNAVLDPLLYPDNARPYLEEGIFSNFNHPIVQEVAQEILESIPEKDRKKQTEVAKAVYLWKIKNVHQDTGKSFYQDYSAGGLISSDWNAGMWGKNFEDWVFRADEAILQKRSICIGGERLSVALLRALNIPARVAPLMAHPVTQWWVQLSDGNGYWANFETSKGNLRYNKDHEDLYTGFPSRKNSEISLIPIDGQKTPVQHHMELNKETWFYEKMQKTVFEINKRGQEAVYSAVEKFKQTGEVPGMKDYWGQIPENPLELEEYYQVTNIGINFKLTNLEEQRIIDVSFPLPNTPMHKLCDLNADNLKCEPVEKANGRLAEYYTNHPEWVEKAEIITEHNSRTGLTMKFLNVRFNLEK